MKKTTIDIEVIEVNDIGQAAKCITDNFAGMREEFQRRLTHRNDLWPKPYTKHQVGERHFITIGYCFCSERLYLDVAGYQRLYKGDRFFFDKSGKVIKVN